MRGISRLLECRGLRKEFRSVVAVDSVDLTAARGEIVALVGPNGSGKTTVLNLISGQIALDKGRVLLEGRRLEDLRPEVRAALGVRRTFQVVRLGWGLSVRQNLDLAENSGALCQAGRGIDGQAEGFSGSHLSDALEELRETTFGAKDDLMVDQLSFGEQKLLALLCMVKSFGSLFLLDEPVGGIDGLNQDRILAVLEEVKREGGSVVICEHDLEAVNRCADRVVLLDRGRVISEGETFSVLQSDVFWHTLTKATNGT